MKFIFISDVHMRNDSSHVESYDENGLSDRIWDQTRLWARVEDMAIKYEVDGIFVLGDLYDQSRPDAVTLTVTSHCIASLPAPTYLLGGNHEGQTDDGDRFVSESLAIPSYSEDSLIKYISAAMSPNGLGFSSKDSGPKLVFWPMEFCPTERAERILKRFRKAMRPEDTNVLLMHHSIVGCTHYGWKCDVGLNPNLVCKGFDWVFTGHFHDSQTFGPDDRGLYLGAPLHLKTDDAGRKAGFWLVEFNGKDCTRKFIDGGAPRFHVHDWPLPKGWASKLDKPPQKGDFIYINVHATKSEWDTLRPKVDATLKKLKELGFRTKRNFKPIYHHEERLSVEVLKSKGAGAMINEYVSMETVKKDGLDESRLIATGREIFAKAGVL